MRVGHPVTLENKSPQTQTTWAQKTPPIRDTPASHEEVGVGDGGRYTAKGGVTRADTEYNRQVARCILIELSDYMSGIAEMSPVHFDVITHAQATSIIDARKCGGCLSAR